MSSRSNSQPRASISSLMHMKQEGQKIVCLTAYDATFASILDKAGVDVILVGDSLGMVIQGHDSTLPVTMDDMVYHTRCVNQLCESALLMGDMPFMSYASTEQAIANAARLMQEGGAQMVKLEGSGIQLDIVAELTRRGIPVCAHLGLQPQAVHKIGGYRVQGKHDAAAEKMKQDALQLQDLGADMLLLECIPAPLATDITQSVDIPVIGIGAGANCDGQILVLQDAIGLTSGHVPKFVHDFSEQSRHPLEAVRAYADAVRSGTFPAEEHQFS